MTAGAPHLRPLGIGEVLDVALKIVWRNAGTLFKIVFFVVFPIQVISALIQWSAVPEFAGQDFSTASEDVQGSDVAAFIGAFAVSGILSFVGSTLASGACFRAIASAYLGERTEWRASLAFALGRLRSILWVTILAGLAAGLGVLLCILPGIYLWVVFSLAIPVLLTEDRRGTAALGRSRDLVRGFWWRTFAVILLGTILASIVGGVIGATVGALSTVDTSADTLVAGVLSVVSGTVAKVLTTPFTAAFVMVLYFDLRVRKEAFDLQLLAERIGVDPSLIRPTQAPSPAPQEPGDEKPPFWPPPPGWKPGGGSPT